MLRLLTFYFCIACVLLISACGDDGAFTDASSSSSSTTTGTTASVASLSLVSSNIQIASDGSDTVTITATVKDAGNALLSGVNVSFSATSGDLTVTQATTDSSGQATATLSAGNDPTNRTITVTASANNMSDSLDIKVSGSQLSIDGPSSLVFGATGDWTVQLKDSGGDGISSELISVTSSLNNTIAADSLETDANGQVKLSLTAITGGTDTLTVSALDMTIMAKVTISSDEFSFTTPAADAEIPLNTSRAVTVRWRKSGSPQSGKLINFSTTRGTLSAASATTDTSGDATVNISSTNAGFAIISATASGGTPAATLEVEFTATTADAINLQADPSSIGPNESSTLTAVVRDPNNNRVKNKTVEFNLVDVTGGNLSVPEAITDSLGRASTVYTATDATSAKDGVKVTATVKDATSVTDTVSLTVAQKSLRITMGTGVELEVPNNVQYKQPWVAQITDADSNAPQANLLVNISALPTQYIKGVYVPSSKDATSGDPEGPWVPAGDSVTCENEDSNRNGILDTGEDFNGNNKLEISNPATVVSDSGEFVTDENGFLYFSLYYPKGNGTWSEVELKATVEVEGTETSVAETYTLPVLADDVEDIGITPPGGVDSPYGTVRNCSDPD
jgi:hypothetical protein